MIQQGQIRTSLNSKIVNMTVPLTNMAVVADIRGLLYTSMPTQLLQ